MEMDDTHHNKVIKTSFFKCIKKKRKRKSKKDTYTPQTELSISPMRKLKKSWLVCEAYLFFLLCVYGLA